MTTKQMLEFKTHQELIALHDKALERSNKVLEMPLDTSEQRVNYIREAMKSIHEVLTSPL